MKLIRIPLLLAALVLAGCTSSGETQSTATLLNTYWKALSIRGQTVTVVENQREPHFVLHLDDHRLAGFSGCNHLMGRYRMQGDQLKFEDVGGTLMACERGMDTEAALTQALRDTARWKITGERLELFDASGASLAKFESVYLR